MNKKISVILFFIMVFVSLISACVECFGTNVKHRGNCCIENKNVVTKERVCRCKSINPRIQPTTTNYINYDVIIEKKAILSEEFESVIYDVKFRPQYARSNMTDGHTEFIPF